MSEWKEGMWLVPEARLDNNQLLSMTSAEVRAFFRPFMKELTTRLPRQVAGQKYVHLFHALHARRPVCGRRLPFEPMDCTFSKRHATCPACVEAVKEAA